MRQPMTVEEYRERETARIAKKHAESDENMKRAAEENRPVEVGTKISDQVGTVYVVVKVETPEDYERNGFEKYATRMRQRGIISTMVCRRPKGTKHFSGWQYREYKNGRGYCYVNQNGWAQKYNGVKVSS